MVASGLSPKQVLLTATRGGAAMMARSSDLGTIERGKLADLAILKENPLDDIAALGAVKLVVRGRPSLRYSLDPERDARADRAAPGQRVQPSRRRGFLRNVCERCGRQASRHLRSDTQRDCVGLRGPFTSNPQLRVEIVERTVNGESVVDKEHVTGFADGRTVDRPLPIR